ncbi:hypothetical protein GCM10023220_39540 [Streptomyces ziwulingensis]|uniref:Monooxygenase n=1 Tax=Streptomyces ziwulingensis TaxID=1045501 RepID=A0ABP9C6S2_9ACTN
MAAAIAADVLGLSAGVHRGEARRGMATSQLGLGHRESSLTHETRPAAGPLRAGDRASGATVADVRLFDAFRGPHWTLLALAAEAPVTPEPVRVVGVIRVVRGPAPAAYGPGLFLVRPDGYVGWAGGPETAGLPAYLARVGLGPAPARTRAAQGLY